MTMTETTPKVDIFDQGRRFAELYRLKKQADDDAKAYAEELRRLEQAIMDDMTEKGIEKFTIGGLDVTLYIHRQLWANAAKDPDTGETSEATKARAIEALREAGLGGMVYETFNVQTLSAHIRTLIPEQGMMPVLPPELEGALDISEKFSLRVIKAGKKRGN
jgi:hypothetical protein